MNLWLGPRQPGAVTIVLRTRAKLRPGEPLVALHIKVSLPQPSGGAAASHSSGVL